MERDIPEPGLFDLNRETTDIEDAAHLLRREQLRLAQQRWRQRNPELHRLRVSIWGKAHRDERAAYKRNWRKLKKLQSGL